MGKLVGQEPSPFFRTGGVSPRSESDVGPQGKGLGIKQPGRFSSCGTRVDPHLAEVGTEAGLEKSPFPFAEGIPAPLQGAHPVRQFVG